MKIIIIGSSGVLGSAIVNQLMERKIEVLTASRKEASDYQLDVEYQEKVSATGRQIITEHPDLNGMVYCPAISIDKMSHRLTPDDWNKVFTINFFSAVVLSSIFIPHLMRKKGGTIQLISSSAAKSGQQGAAAYAASKAAIDNYVKTVSQEYSRYGLNIHSICPGYFHGGLMKNVSSDTQKKIIEGTPAKYIPQADEIAAFCCDLLLGSKYTTGSNFLITGGK